jgi:hypothetical protein
LTKHAYCPKTVFWVPGGKLGQPVYKGTDTDKSLGELDFGIFTGIACVFTEFLTTGFCAAKKWIHA